MVALVRGPDVLICDEKEEIDIFTPVLNGPQR